MHIFFLFESLYTNVEYTVECIVLYSMSDTVSRIAAVYDRSNNTYIVTEYLGRPFSISIAYGQIFTSILCIVVSYYYS